MHFAAIPRVLIEPDNVTFAANVMSTYNVIEAAMKLGVRKVIIASSETTYGVCFAEGDKDFHSFPLEEDYDIDPMDSYGLSKVCNEKTARAFAMRYQADIYALQDRQRDRAARIRRIQALRRRPAGAQAQRLELYRRARPRRDRAAVHREGRARLPGVQCDQRHDHAQHADRERRWRGSAPKTPVTRKMGEYEAPLSNRKIREVLGFKEAHDWRNTRALSGKPLRGTACNVSQNRGDYAG